VSEFETALDMVLRFEGGDTDDPRDAGGFTRFGISIRFAGSIYLDLDGDGKTTKEDMKALTRKKAAAIYREHFWDRVIGERLPPAVAMAVFDFAVNCGVPSASRRLQRAIGAKADGRIGEKTIAAAWKIDPMASVADLTARRCKKYAETKQVKIYGLGWMRRAASVHQNANALHLYRYQVQ
jgi:lysozyme family protein